jgi:hypothetical protein
VGRLIVQTCPAKPILLERHTSPREKGGSQKCEGQLSRVLWNNERKLCASLLKEKALFINFNWLPMTFVDDGYKERSRYR